MITRVNKLDWTITGDGISQWFVPPMQFPVEGTRLYPGSSKKPLTEGVDYTINACGKGKYINDITFTKPLQNKQQVVAKYYTDPVPEVGETWWIKLPQVDHLQALCVSEITDKVVVLVFPSGSDLPARRIGYKLSDVEFVEFRYREKPGTDTGHYDLEA